MKEEVFIEVPGESGLECIRVGAIRKIVFSKGTATIIFDKDQLLTIGPPMAECFKTALSKVAHVEWAQATGIACAKDVSSAVTNKPK